MNESKLEMGGQSIQGKAGVWRWLGLTAGLAAVAALAATLYVAAWPAAPAPVVNKPAQPIAQSVPDAAQQGVMGYLRAHGAGQVADTAPDIARREARDAAAAQSAPDAAQQGVMGYLRAHGAGQPAAVEPSWLRAQDDPSFHSPVVDRSFHTPQTSDYAPVDRSFHTPQTSNYVQRVQGAPTGQTAPDAIAQSYFLQLFAAQTAPNAAFLGVMHYLRAHGALVTIP